MLLLSTPLPRLGLAPELPSHGLWAVLSPRLCPAQLQGLWADVPKTGRSQGSTHVLWCAGVIGHGRPGPGMRAGLCPFQAVVLLSAPSRGANNTLPIARSHTYMKFKTIQPFSRFWLTDETRESLSAYLKAPLCSKARLSPQLLEGTAFVTKSRGTSLAARPWVCPGG